MKVLFSSTFSMGSSFGMKAKYSHFVKNIAHAVHIMIVYSLSVSHQFLPIKMVSLLPGFTNTDFLYLSIESLLYSFFFLYYCDILVAGNCSWKEFHLVSGTPYSMTK